MAAKTTNSMYARGIKLTVEDWFRIHNKAFTLKDLAAFGGFRVTTSFRRRLRQLVDEGELATQFIGFGGGHGSTVIYLKPEWEVQELQNEGGNGG